MPDNTTNLDAAQYCSLETFKRDGSGVRTPVWFGGDSGVYYIFSAGNAGKVKRLRNASRARLARCNVTGDNLGDWMDGNAYLLESTEEQQEALDALHEKYGWQMWVTDLASSLSGKKNKRAYIKVVLD